jgi:hypothetical protein
MRDRSSIWIGLADLLLCVLSVVIVAVAPKTPAVSGVPEKAEYLMSAEWSVDLDADVDIWMAPPSKKPVFYGSRDVGCARLDSDNRGFVDEWITLADGTKVKVDSDKETISLRCIEPGHYDLGVNEAKLVDLWLRCDDGPPRSYETTLDERMKKTLRQAREEMDSGRPAMLAKRKPATGSANGLANAQDENEYVLDDSVRFALPPND